MTYGEFKHLQEQGRTQPKLKLVECHVYDIPSRIVDTFGDENWFVCWNPDTGRFEIHYDGKAFHTMEMDVEFDELDQRTIDQLLKNRAYKAKEIIAAMIKKNEQRELAASAKAHSIARDALSDAYDYNDHHPSKTVDHDELRAVMKGVV